MVTAPVAVTGADLPMGAALCRGLSAEGEVIAIGEASDPPNGLGDARQYRCADLRDPDTAREALRGAGFVVHAQPHDPPPGEGAADEARLLDAISRGTYVLVQAAREAGISRLVLVSPISLMQDYEEYVAEPWWRPHPRPDGAGLAPYLAELVCREIARTGAIEVRCLRMGPLDDPRGTSSQEAVAAVGEALRERSGDRRVLVARGPRPLRRRLRRRELTPWPPSTAGEW